MSDTVPASFGLTSVSLEAAIKKPFVHFDVNKESESEVDANTIRRILLSMIDALSKANEVYVRRMPEVRRDNHFDESHSRWLTVARFSVGEKK